MTGDQLFITPEEAYDLARERDAAVELLRKAQPACEVKHWSGAGEHPVLGPLSREIDAFLKDKP